MTGIRVELRDDSGCLDVRVNADSKAPVKADSPDVDLTLICNAARVLISTGDISYLYIDERLDFFRNVLSNRVSVTQSSPLTVSPRVNFSIHC